MAELDNQTKNNAIEAEIISTPAASSAPETQPSGEAGEKKPVDQWAEKHMKQTASGSNKWLIAGLILLIVIGAGMILFSKEISDILNGGNNPDQNNDGEGIIHVQLLLDKTCLTCTNTNTILQKFDEVGMKYEVEEIDVSSPLGKTLISRFGITYVPTAILSLTGLEQNPPIQSALIEVYGIQSGAIVVPESFWDNKPHNIKFLESPNPICSLNFDNPEIKEISDYFCTICAKNHEKFKALKAYFANDKVDFETTSFLISTRDSNEAVQISQAAALAVECADGQGRKEIYQECMFKEVLAGRPSGVPDAIKTCSFSAGIPDKNSFNSCVESGVSAVKLANAIHDAIVYQVPKKWIPTYIVDCKYPVVGPEEAIKTLCTLHPELTGCPTVLADINSGALDEEEINLQSCQVDADCVKVAEGCCGCNEGGKAIAINVDYQVEYLRQQGVACEQVACTQNISSDATCQATAQPACRSNTCVLIDASGEIVTSGSSLSSSIDGNN